MNDEKAKKVGHANKSHGMRYSKTYTAWAAMWGRCTNPNNCRYELYKGRVPPERWKSFKNFLEDMGEVPEGYSLERKDNKKAYSPENCKWIPKAQQGSNTSRVRFVTNKEITLPLIQAVKYLNLIYAQVYYKLVTRKTPVEEILGKDWSWVESKQNL